MRKEWKLEVLVVVAGYVKDGDFDKQLLICGDCSCDEAFFESLKLVEEQLPGKEPNMRFFLATDPAFSRKKFAPKFLAFFS